MATYEEMLMNQSAANSAFNASQAEINRDWQEYMSSTSHQRETKDLIAAGLNPVLSANSGSSWQNVANATADPTSASGLAALATTMLNNAVSLEQSKISAEATKAAAGASAAAQVAAAEMNSSATRFAAEQSRQGTQFSAEKHYQTGIETSPVGIAYNAAKGTAESLTGGQVASSYDAGKFVGNLLQDAFSSVASMVGY